MKTDIYRWSQIVKDEAGMRFFAELPQSAVFRTCVLAYAQSSLIQGLNNNAPADPVFNLLFTYWVSDVIPMPTEKREFQILHAEKAMELPPRAQYLWTVFEPRPLPQFPAALMLFEILPVLPWE